MKTPPIDRRTFLRLGATTAGLAATGGLLGACGGDDPSAPEAAGSQAGGAGGTLRVGALGAPSDVLDLRTSGGLADFIILHNVWDALALLRGGGVELALAEEIVPNADATVWTVRLRQGVTFHDGRSLTVGDVAYSIRYYGDPATSPIYGQVFGDIDLANLRVLDERTLEVPLLRPRADLLESVLGIMSLVFPDGITDLQSGNGSGPFRLATYEQGQGARLEANPEHWRGAPALAGLEVRMIADPGARLAGVRGGELDYAVAVTPAAAASVEGDPALSIRRGGPANAFAYLFAANVGVAPFTDPRVPQALRLAVDRQALVDTVLLGQGRIGNDVVGLGLPGYAEGLEQRRRDVEEARSMFAAAGVDRLTIRAADITTGLVDSATLLVGQLKEVGVTLTVEEVAADTYFSDFATLLSTPLQAFALTNRPPGANIAANLGSRAPFNLTGYAPPAFDALLADFQATVDDDARAAKLVELQTMLYEDDGAVVWGIAEQLDVARSGVEGVTLTNAIPQFASATMAS